MSVKIPDKITRAQLADACRALGLDPATVQAFSADAKEGVVHVVLAPIPNQLTIVTSHAAIPVVHADDSHASHASHHIVMGAVPAVPAVDAPEAHRG